MRYLGLDLGTRTLGMALSDATGSIATVLETIRFDGEYESLLPELKGIIEQYQIEKIVLGLPKNMNNTIGERGEIALQFRELLEENLNMDVEMQDERLSTVEATNYMLQADISRKKRKKKIDGLAASIILQTYLNKKKGK